MNGAEPGREGFQPVEIGLFGHGVDLPVLVGARREFRDIHVDKLAVVEKVGLKAEQFVELGQEQIPVNWQRPESSASFGLELGEDQPRQRFEVGPRQPAESFAKGLAAEVLFDQPLEGGVLEPLQTAVV